MTCYFSFSVHYTWNKICTKFVYRLRTMNFQMVGMVGEHKKNSLQRKQEVTNFQRFFEIVFFFLPKSYRIEIGMTALIHRVFDIGPRNRIFLHIEVNWEKKQPTNTVNWILVSSLAWLQIILAVHRFTFTFGI